MVFDKEAHRGGLGLMPENSLPTMINAVSLGATTLEMGVYITKDKKVILSHEPFFNHAITTKPDGSYIDEKDERNYNLYQMDYSEIVKYDVGMKSDPQFPDRQKIRGPKPLLSDVFKFVKEFMTREKRPYPFFNIEINTNPATDNIFNPAPGEFVELVMQVVMRNDMKKQVIIQSADMRTLQYLHKTYPKIKTSLLVNAGDRNSFRKQLTDLGFEPTIYSPEQALVTSNLISACHEKNIKIIPWTINDKAKIESLRAMGVDGVITDYPNLF